MREFAFGVVSQGFYFHLSSLFLTLLQPRWAKTEAESKGWCHLCSWKLRPFFQLLKYELGKHWVIHHSLYLLNASKKDLLEFCKVWRITDSWGWFTELNFKNTFCIPLNKKGQGLSKGKNVKRWTNSEYAFNVFGEVICKERGLATQGHGIEHTEQIHALLQSI